MGSMSPENVEREGGSPDITGAAAATATGWGAFWGFIYLE